MAITWLRLAITNSFYLPTQCAAQIHGYHVETHFLFDVKSENQGCSTHFQQVCLETRNRKSWDEWMRCRQGNCRLIHDTPSWAYLLSAKRLTCMLRGWGSQFNTSVSGCVCFACRPIIMVHLMRCTWLEPHLVLPVDTGCIQCALKTSSRMRAVQACIRRTAGYIRFAVGHVMSIQGTD